MKRLFRLMLIAAIAVAAQSCEGPTGPEGPMGPAGPAGKDGTPFYINKEFTVDSEHWIDNGNCYVYTFEVEELTADICNSASINVYYYDADDYQYQLPYEEYNWEDDGEAQKDPNTGEIIQPKWYYSQLIRYDFAPGEITFVVAYTDFRYNTPPSMDFRLVVHY